MPRKPIHRQNTKRRNPKKRRRYNTRRIKQHHSYQIAEIAKLYGLHKNAVGQWLKKGLPVNDTSKPYLIHGTALKAFLDRMQQARKAKCRQGYLYCVKCRMPQQPRDMAVHITLLNNRCLHLKATCSVCGTSINQFASKRNLAALQTVFETTNSHPLLLIPPVS